MNLKPAHDLTYKSINKLNCWNELVFATDLQSDLAKQIVFVTSVRAPKGRVAVCPDVAIILPTGIF